jgi:hypothetical protein
MRSGVLCLYKLVYDSYVYCVTNAKASTECSNTGNVCMCVHSSLRTWGSRFGGLSSQENKART